MCDVFFYKSQSKLPLLVPGDKNQPSFEHSNRAKCDIFSSLSFYGAGRFNNMFPDGRYATLGELLITSAISSAASILRSSISPSPASLNDFAIKAAPWASPSTDTMVASFCCSAW